MARLRLEPESGTALVVCPLGGYTENISLQPLYMKRCQLINVIVHFNVVFVANIIDTENSVQSVEEYRHSVVFKYRT